MLEHLSARIVFMLVDLSVKGLALACLAALTLWVFRRASVHTQHRVWTVVLLTWLSLPAFHAAGVSWRLPLGMWPVEPVTSAEAEAPAGAATAAAERNPVDPASRVMSASLSPQDGTPAWEATYGRADNPSAARTLRNLPPAGPAERSRAEDRVGPHVGATSSPGGVVGASRLGRNLAFLPAAGAWLAGGVLLLVRFLIAALRCWRWTQSATPIDALDLASLPAASSGIAVRESDRIDSPVVVGWWRPCILLPRGWREWSLAKRAAVLAHEGAHIRRRDPLVSLLAELASGLYWFHPVSWFVRRRLGQLAELACDQTAAVETGDRFGYARALLEIAAANRSETWLRLAVAMARGSEIGPRVRALLDLSRPLADRISWPALMLVLLVGLPAALGIGLVRPTAAAQDAATQKAAPQTAATPPNETKAAAPPQQTDPPLSKSEDASPPGTPLPVLTIQGTAVLPDGTVAKDAVLEPTEEGPSGVLSAEITEGRFKIRTTGTVMNPPNLGCRTPDGAFQARLLMQGHTLRQMSRGPLRLTLEPAQIVRVTVREGERPAGAAHVQVRTDSGNSRGATNAEGVAEVRVPRGESVFGVAAWTADHKVGGLNTYLRRANHEEGASFAIDLTPTTTVRARVVDAQRKPLPQVPLTLSVDVEGTSAGFWGVPMLSQVTDAQGEVTFAWVPDWPKKDVSVTLAEGSPWRHLGEDWSKCLPDGTFELDIAPSRTSERIEVEGTLTGGTADNAGLLVEFWSYQSEQENLSEVLQARTDSQGRFRTKVLPGSDYFVHVDDSELVGTTWSGVLALSREAAPRTPDLKLIPGTQVEIALTQGQDRGPLRNAWLHFESQHRDNHSRRFWGKTDEYGRCAVMVAPGRLDIRVTAGDWELKKQVEVAEGVPLQVPLHRQFAERQTIRGRLTLPEGMTADLSETSVKVTGFDGESHDTASVKADREGGFTAQIAAGRVSIMASVPDEKVFGVGIFDVGSAPVDVPLQPTVPLEGRVVDDEDRPMPGITVAMRGWLSDRQQNDTPLRGSRSRKTEIIPDRETATDADGRFMYPNAPQRVELSLRFTRPGETEPAAWQDRWLEPGESRPPEVIRLPSKTPAAKPPRPLSVVIPETLRDCRLSGIRALVAVTGEGDGPPAFLKHHVLDGDKVKDIYAYFPRTVHGPAAAGNPASREVFAAHDWPFPKPNTLFLAALDGEGKELGRLTLDLRDDLEAAGAVAGFLEQHRAPQVDAQAGFDAALAEAKRSSRRLWVRSGGSRCGPCFSLSRWIDSQKELLERDYVLFRFDEFLDQHGRELSSALKFDEHGIPCFAILDEDGTPLITSVGPLGNIGDPKGSHEGIAHLRKMLTTTARTLSTAEIDTLIGSLSTK